MRSIILCALALLAFLVGPFGLGAFPHGLSHICESSRNSCGGDGDRGTDEDNCTICKALGQAGGDASPAPSLEGASDSRPLEWTIARPVLSREHLLALGPRGPPAGLVALS